MKLICLFISMCAAPLLGMEPLISSEDHKNAELVLEWQITLADGKRLMADYDNRYQTITLLELAQGSAKQLGSADMKDLIPVDELTNIKVLGLARLPKPQEYIALLIANKKNLQDTLVCMRVDLNKNRERIKAVQFYAPLSTFVRWRLTLDQTHTQLTILARARTLQKNVYEEHQMPVSLPKNDDFLVATATTKQVVRDEPLHCTIL